ncbi:MAG: TldD/PmbA family protein, partial [Actinomycetota bacterium]|nr:TldD/PmbA family protein [Actinomycetota bacterium]
MVALGSGGDFAEVFAEERSFWSVEVDGSQVEGVDSGRSLGAAVRVVAGNTVGHAHTTDVSERGLCLAAEVAGAVGRGHGLGGSSRPVAGPKKPGAGLGRIGDSADRAGAIELLRRADSAARGVTTVRQVRVGWSHLQRRIMVANSEGLIAHDEVSRTRIAVTAVASAGHGAQTGFESAAVAGNDGATGADVDRVARLAADRADTKLRARPA